MTISLAELLPDSTTRTQAGGLCLAGSELARLGRDYGTPLYIYDALTVRRNVATLTELLEKVYPAASEIAYAAKAYFSPGVAQKISRLGIGVDVVSLAEFRIAQKAGFPASKIHVHGNNKSEVELEAAIQANVQAVVVDSLDELELLEKMAVNTESPVRIWLRITPGIDVDTHRYVQTGHPASKFGLSIGSGQASEAIRIAKKSKKLSLSGLHTHLGSQFFDPQPYRQAVTRMVELAAQENYIPQVFSTGGGWGVPYNPDGISTTDPAPWISAVAGAVQDEFSRRDWPLPRLVLEPGRWLVARAGVAIYTVGAVKPMEDGRLIVAVDGGMADNPRPALYQARYTAFLPENPDGKATRDCMVVGKFCESGDILIPAVKLPQVRRGDLLAIPVSGAYQLSMASNYNLAPRPAVLWLEDARIDVLQKREKLEEGGWWAGE